MARTGQAENQQANATLAGDQSQAFGAGQGYVSQFGKNLATLAKGGNVLANPWQQPAYLGNVNRLQSGALNSAQGAADAELRATNRRTGGMNNTSVYGATQALAGQKMRLADQLSAERAAGDQNKNVQYQLEGAQLPLAGAQAESPYYGTATSGRASALGNLTQLGIAQYGPWNSLIQGAMQGAGTGAGMAAG